MVNIDKLKQILDRQDLFVKFTKKNGEERVMRCTRSVYLIPKDQMPKGIGIVKDGVTPVYDLDNDGWRIRYYLSRSKRTHYKKFLSSCSQSNRVLEEAHKAPLPEVYIAKYLESFIRYNLYETCPEVREKIANLNELHERLSSEVDYEQLDKNFLQ